MPGPAMERGHEVASGAVAWMSAGFVLTAVAALARNSLLGPGAGDLALQNVVDSVLAIFGTGFGGSHLAMAVVVALQALLGFVLGAALVALRRAIGVSRGISICALVGIVMLFQWAMSAKLALP